MRAYYYNSYSYCWLLVALALLRLIAVYWVSSSASVVGRKWNSHLKHNETTFTIQLFIYVVVKFFKLRALHFVLSMTKGSLLCVRAQQCAALHDKRFAALRLNAKMRCHAALCAITAHAHTVQHCVMLIDNDVKHGCQLPVIVLFRFRTRRRRYAELAKPQIILKHRYKFKYIIIQNA